MSVSLLDICIVSLTSFNAQTLYHFTKPNKSERKPFCSQRFHCIVAMIWKLITAFWEFLEDKRKEKYDIVPIASNRHLATCQGSLMRSQRLGGAGWCAPICPIQSHSGMYTTKDVSKQGFCEKNNSIRLPWDPFHCAVEALLLLGCFLRLWDNALDLKGPELELTNLKPTWHVCIFQRSGQVTLAP